MKKSKRGYKQPPPRNKELYVFFDSLPWDQWKLDYITRKNPDGTWYYRHLKHFAMEQLSGKDVRNNKFKPTSDQLIRVVQYKCGPFAVASGENYQQETSYHSDWNEARVGYRWGTIQQRASTDLAKIDRQVYLLERLEFPLTKYQILIERALKMMGDIEGHFQGRFLLEDTPYQSAVAPRTYRGSNPKEQKKADRIQAEYDLLLAQERAQTDRFNIYCTMMDRAHKMFELACEGYRKCLSVGVPKIELRQQINNTEQLQAVQAIHQSNNMERIATAFLENASETARNFQFDPPKFVTVTSENTRIEEETEKEGVPLTV